MANQFQELFSVHFQHKYFTDKDCTIFSLSPTKETNSIAQSYGLLFKSVGDGINIFFNTTFLGSNRDREILLKENITLRFIIHLTDPLFYNYTTILSNNLNNKRVFWFRNFDENQKVWKNTDVLHSSEYVLESDTKLVTDFENLPIANSFGYIEIQLNSQLPEKLYVRFLNRATYWRYIITGENIHKYENLAIINRMDQKLFAGPEIIVVPNGLKGLAFTSSEPIELTNQTNNSFQLGNNYNPINKHFTTIVMSNLPKPDVSHINVENDIYFSNIYINI